MSPIVQWRSESSQETDMGVYLWMSSDVSGIEFDNKEDDRRYDFPPP